MLARVWPEARTSSSGVRTGNHLKVRFSARCGSSRRSNWRWSSVYTPTPCSRTACKRSSRRFAVLWVGCIELEGPGDADPLGAEHLFTAKRS